MAITTANVYTATGGGNTASGSITIPAGLPSGSAGYIIFTQNNADVLTAVPAYLTLADNTSSGSANFVSKLYTFKVGDGSGNTVTAGTSVAFTMSAVRAWTTTLYAVSGVDQTTPIVLVAVAGSVTTSVVIPTATTTQALWLTEVGVGKANGSVVSSWTPPAGWSNRITTPSPTTFGASVIIADRDAGLAGASNYGGETYTPSAAIATAERYIIGFQPATVALTYYTPADDTGATTAGWTKTPSGAATYASVVSDSDNATYAESPVTPSSSVFQLAIPNVTVPTDLSTVQIQIDMEYASGTSGSAIITLLQSGVTKKTGSAQTLTTGWSTYYLTLTSADANALTVTTGTWQNLAVRVTATAS
jgi:hypothetical protein